MNARPVALALPFAVGAATALSLGIYAAAHEPTGRDFVVTGFASVAGWKSAFASVTMALVIVQVSLGLRLTGRVGPRVAPPPWAHDLHRLVGTVAFGISIPVAFHCIWAVGYQSSDSRLAVHSLFGCVAYGSYVAKIMTARTADRPQWALPAAGSLLGIMMLTVWWSSAFVHYLGSNP